MSHHFLIALSVTLNFLPISENDLVLIKIFKSSLVTGNSVIGLICDFPKQEIHFFEFLDISIPQSSQ